MTRVPLAGRTVALALFLSLVAGATSAVAQATRGVSSARTSADSALARLEAALANDSSLSPELRSALTDLVAALRAERSASTPGVVRTTAPATAPLSGPTAASVPPPEPPARPAAVAPKRIEPFGDFRYRHETTDFAADGTATRQRERLRVRAGLQWRPGSELTIAGGLQTGERDEPKSPHATLGSGFRSLAVNVSIASATWQPARVKGLRLTGGKFVSQLVTNPVYSEMVWDQDIRPEGGLASWSLGGRGRVGGSAGYYVVQERAGAADAGAFVAQGFARAALGPAQASLALGYYGFDEDASRRPGTLLPLAAGNVTQDLNGDGQPDRLASDFRLWHPIASLRLQAAGRPLVVAGEYVRNSRAIDGQGDAVGIGASWGATRRRGEWQAYYQYLDIEPDAVFALVSQDDLTRTTNLRGHLFGVRVQLLDKAGVNAWALSAKPHVGNGSLDWRYRVDLNVSY